MEKDVVSNALRNHVFPFPLPPQNKTKSQTHFCKHCKGELMRIISEKYNSLLKLEFQKKFSFCKPKA